MLGLTFLSLKFSCYCDDGDDGGGGSDGDGDDGGGGACDDVWYVCSSFPHSTTGTLELSSAHQA